MGALEDSVAAGEAGKTRRAEAEALRAERHSAALASIDALAVEYAEALSRRGIELQPVTRVRHPGCWLVGLYIDEWRHTMVLVFPGGRWTFGRSREVRKGITRRPGFAWAPAPLPDGLTFDGPAWMRSQFEAAAIKAGMGQ